MARPRHELTVVAVTGGRTRGAGAGGGPLPALLAIVGLLCGALIGLPTLLGHGAPADAGPGPSATRARAGAVPGSVPSAGGRASPPAATTGPSGGVPRPGPTATPTPSAPGPAATPTSAASPARVPGAAPAGAAQFDLQGQVIDIGFPLKERTRYNYRDNFLDARDGEAHAYNHARLRRGDRLLRAHDGTDIYAPTGAPVVSPFDGVVIDPSTRWQPWIRERYGKTAVIVSSEPTSEGYAAILSHLEAVFVEPGQHVHRGEVIGLNGATGNAEGGPPHLHFELRAPFPLSWEQVGDDRLIDAFNPYPSLRAADPRRSG